MIENKLEQELEEEIKRFFDARDKYVATKHQLGSGFNAIVELQKAEDKALKAILLFLRQPTGNPVPYLWIVNYIRNLTSKNGRSINENVIVILRRLMDAHSSFNLADELVEPVYLEILSELLKHSSFSMIIRGGNTFRFNLRLVTVIKFFEDKGKKINGLSPRDWVKEFYRLNIEYLVRNSIGQTITKFHNAMVPFDEIYHGIVQEFSSIQAFYQLKS